MIKVKKENAEIIYDMSNKAYHATDAIGSHTVIDFGRSAAHAVVPLDEPTRAMEFGSACHKRSLEQEDFYEEFAIPTLSLRSKAGKELAAELNAKDLTVISEPDFDLIKEMKEALTPESEAYLSGAERELSIFWKREELPCKCRPDSLVFAGKDESGVSWHSVVDYKTAADAAPHGFKSAILRYGYDQQASWYSDGVAAAGYNVREFVFVVQEKKPPYVNMVYKLSGPSILKAQDKNEEAVEILLDYQRTKIAKPFNSDNVMEIDVV